MSWLVKALTICTTTPDDYYTVIDPVNFYEWRFQQSIPKGTIFTKRLPKTETFTDNLLIASAHFSPDKFIHHVRGDFELRENTPADITITAGAIPTPTEMMEKFSNLSKSFNRKLHEFKLSAQNQQFMLSADKKPTLLHIASCDNEVIKIESYGDIKNIMEQFEKTLSALMARSAKKSWRSYEMENPRRFENYMVDLREKNPIDAAKMSFLITTAGVKPIAQFDMSWHDLFLKSSPDAQSHQKTIEQFNSMNWVKQSQEYFQTKKV